MVPAPTKPDSPALLTRWMTWHHLRGALVWLFYGLGGQLLRDVLQDRRDGLINQAIDKAGAWLTGQPDNAAVVNEFLSGWVERLFSNLPIVLPLLYIAVTLERARRDDVATSRDIDASQLVSEGWLQEQLLTRFEDQADTVAHVEDCLRFLQVAGVLSQNQVIAFLDDRQCYADLLTIYREELNEPTRVVDAYGYCFWGPRLHRAAPEHRQAVIAHIRIEVRRFYNREAGREMTQSEQISRQIARLTERRAKLLGPTPPVLRFGAPEDRAHEGWLIWWHIPISVAEEHEPIEDCRVVLREDRVAREWIMHWSHPTGPARQVETLRYAGEPRWVPIAVRAERDCRILDFAVQHHRPMLTDAEALITHANYTYLAQPLPYRFRLVRSERWEWKSPLYEINLPHFRESNKAFRMQRATTAPNAELVTGVLRDEDSA